MSPYYSAILLACTFRRQNCLSFNKPAHDSLIQLRTRTHDLDIYAITAQPVTLPVANFFHDGHSHVIRGVVNNS